MKFIFYKLTIFLFISFTTLLANDNFKVEKHRVGRFKVEQRGHDAKVWLRAATDYQAKVDSKLVKRIKSGKLKYFNSDKNGTSYQLAVPKNYRKELPFGLVVYISASADGTFPHNYSALLEKYHLIGIGANNSGNKDEGTITRHSLAVAAAKLCTNNYNIDLNRVYISGSSGGGRVASQAMMMNCDLFKGGFPLIGANPLYHDALDSLDEIAAQELEKIKSVSNVKSRVSKYIAFINKWGPAPSVDDAKIFIDEDLEPILEGISQIKSKSVKAKKLKSFTKVYTQGEVSKKANTMLSQLLSTK